MQPHAYTVIINFTTRDEATKKVVIQSKRKESMSG